MLKKNDVKVIKTNHLSSLLLWVDLPLSPLLSPVQLSTPPLPPFAMPDWCYNHLQITHPSYITEEITPSLETIAKHVRENTLCSFLIPSPAPHRFPWRPFYNDVLDQKMRQEIAKLGCTDINDILKHDFGFSWDIMSDTLSFDPTDPGTETDPGTGETETETDPGTGETDPRTETNPGTDGPETDPRTDDPDSKTISFFFNTAWLPPTAIYDVLDDLNYEVVATYYAPELEYCGVWNCGTETSYHVFDETDYFYNYDSDGVLLDEHYDLLDIFQEYSNSDDDYNSSIGTDTYNSNDDTVEYDSE